MNTIAKSGTLRYDPASKEKVEQLEWPEELSEFKKPFDDHAAILDAAWKTAEAESSSPTELSEKFKTSIAEHQAAHRSIQEKLITKIEQYPEFNKKVSQLNTTSWEIIIYNELSFELLCVYAVNTFGHYETKPPPDTISPGDYGSCWVGNDLLGRCNGDIHYQVQNSWETKPDYHFKYVMWSSGGITEWRYDVAPGYAQPYYLVKVDWGVSFTCSHK